MRAHIRIHIHSLLTDFGRIWQNLAGVDQVGRIWQNSIELAEFGRIHLSSVSPRHSYCNWASPVTVYKIWGE